MFIAAVQAWWFITRYGTLEADTTRYEPDSSTMAVDHVVELQMIIQFFTTDYNSTQGATRNQWQMVQDFINTNGRRPPPSPAVGGTVSFPMTFLSMIDAVDLREP